MKRALVSLALIVCLAFLPLAWLVAGANWPLTGDVPAHFGPTRQWMGEQLRSGTLPLWNPHLFAGLPQAANGQSGLWYPPNWIFFFLPQNWGAWADGLFHTIWTAWGFYFWLRALNLSRRAAWGGAVLFAFSGAVSGHLWAGHLSWGATRAWLPWQLGSLIFFLRTGKSRFFVGWGVALGLGAAAGAPALWLGCLALNFVALGGYFVRNRTVSRVPDVLAAGALALALAAPTLLPLLELRGWSAHSELGFAEATAASVNGLSLARLFLGGLWSGEAVSWTPLIPQEEVAFLGIAAMVLAIFSPVLARPERRNLLAPLAFLAVAALAMALGNHTPLYDWLFMACAPLRAMRVPLRWLEFWPLAVATLAALSLDGLLAGREPSRRLATLAGSVAVAFLGMSVTINLLPISGPYWAGVTAPALGLAGSNASPALRDALAIQLSDAATRDFLVSALGSGFLAAFFWKWRQISASKGVWMILGLLTVNSLWHFGRGAMALPREIVLARLMNSPQSETLARPARFPQELASFLLGERWATATVYTHSNSLLPPGIDSLGGYDPIASERAFRFAAVNEGAPFSLLDNLPFWSGVWEMRRFSPLLRVAGVTRIVTFGVAPTDDTSGVNLETLASVGPWKVSHLRWNDFPEGPWPRTFLTRNIQVAVNDAGLMALQKFAAERQSPAAWPVVLETPRNVSFSPLQVGEDITMLFQTSNLAMLRYAAQKPAILVQNEALAPGWKAWVNENPSPVLSANYLFRGVEVPAGNGKVEFVYDSQTLRFGLFLALGAMLVLLASLTSRKVRQRVRLRS